MACKAAEVEDGQTQRIERAEGRIQRAPRAKQSKQKGMVASAATGRVAVRFTRKPRSSCDARRKSRLRTHLLQQHGPEGESRALPARPTLAKAHHQRHVRVSLWQRVLGEVEAEDLAVGDLHGQHEEYEEHTEHAQGGNAQGVDAWGAGA